MQAIDPQPFDLAWVGKYLPHYLKNKPSLFHEELIDDLSTLHTVRGQKLDYLGPRESGKSTWISKAFPLWCALEALEPLILLLADSDSQVQEYLSSIKNELEGNADIRRDYPHAAGVGQTWKIDGIKLRNGMVIKTKGASGKMLGMTSGANRPTLVIGDDLNARSDAYSPTVRTRRMHWFNTDVLNIGTLGFTNYVVAGTTIHRGAVACVLSNTPGWVAKTYRSIIEWPTRMDLWEEWERIYSNLADEDRDAKADQFYVANRSEMDAGAVLLWPDKEKLIDLMKLRAAVGPAAFDTERQGKPGTDGATEFPDSWFTPGMMFDSWPGGLKVKVVACDPSKGSDAKAGDYQAIASVALHSDGVFYADMSLKREPVPTMAERFALTAKEWTGVSSMGIETNSTLGLLLPEIDRAMRLAGVVCPCKGIHNTLSKGARIRRIGGYLSRGQLRIRNTPGGGELVEQLRQFPNGDFDDGCFVAGTMIATEHGRRPIERIETGDLVWTRQGLRPVIAAGCTGVRAVIEVHCDGRTLTGTPNHPVFDGDSFTRMDKSFTMASCEHLNQWSSSSTVSPFGDTRTRSNGLTGVTTRRTPVTAALELVRSIKRFGSKLTGRFHRDVTSTTRMIIQRTMPSAICGVSPKKNTTRFIRQNGVVDAEHRNPGDNLQMPQRRLLSGTLRQPESNGIVRTLERVGKAELLSRSCAHTAEQPTQHSFLTEPSSVPPSAGSAPTQPTVGMRIVRVQQRRNLHPEKVYNLSVADCPEYIANGFLVHNCDALEIGIRLIEELVTGNR